MPDPNYVGGLKWVQGEIVASLRRVRGWLETFVDQGGPEGGLADAVAALKEVRGVLAALQLSGPARLAEEMQTLCEEMSCGRIGSLGEASEALMLALIQLPDYLDRLRARHPDAPVALLGSINDLRSTRQARPLTEAEVLVPTSVLAEAGVPLPEVQAAIRRVAVKVRPHFHRSLLQWFRPDTSRQGLVSLGRLFHQLQRYIREGVFHELFLAAEAVVEGLLDGSLSADGHIKALIGRLDRVIKPFTEDPDAWPEGEAQLLLNDFLSLIAGCDSSSYLMGELRSAYRLERAQDGQGPASLPQGPGPEALGVLAAEARRELVPIKDALDLYARGSRDDRSKLSALAPKLRSLANTLSILGNDDLIERLHRCEHQCAAFGEADGTIDERDLVAAAEQLLAVESALTELTAGDAGQERAPAMGEFAGAALREARVDMMRAQQAIAELASESGGSRLVQEVPDLFHRVAGALRVLAEDEAAEVLDAVVEQVRHRYLAGGRLPARRELDLLAGTISGVDLYIEGLSEGALYRPDLIAQARSILAELEALPGGTAPRAVADEPASWADELFDVPEPPAVGAEAVATLIDPEFLEIFLEEARDEERNAQDQLARWQRDGTDQAALTSLRRSFHTLKGSGRLVGAQRVGELACAVEMLLNRVIDGTVQASADLVDCVEQAVGLLPALIEAEATGTPFDVSGPVARAEGLALAGSLAGASDRSRDAVPENLIPWPTAAVAQDDAEAASAAPEVAEEAGEADAAMAAEVAALAQVDEELLDIFRSEAQDHLGVLRTYVAEAAAAPQQSIPPDGMVRALHTLTGSARMTGIASAAAATGALEKLFAAYREVGADADRPALDLLSTVIDTISLRLEHLPGSGSELATLHELGRAGTAQLRAFGAAGEEGQSAVPSAEEERSGQPEDVSVRDQGVRGLHGEGEPSEPVGIDLDFQWELPGEPLPHPESTAGEGKAAAEAEAVGIDLDFVWQPATDLPAEPVESLPIAQPSESLGLNLEQDAGAVAGAGVRGEHAVPGEAPGLDAELTQRADEGPAPVPDQTGEGEPERVEAMTGSGLRDVPLEEVVAEDVSPDAIKTTSDRPSEAAELSADAGVEPAPAEELSPEGAAAQPEEGSPTQAWGLAAMPWPTATTAGAEANREPVKPPPDDLAELPADSELLGLFLEDARDLLDKLDQSLRNLQLSPTAVAPIEELQRHLHTLKGSARLSGLAPIGDLSHALESLLTAIARGDAQVDDDTLELAQRSLDALSDQVEAVEGRAPLRRFQALVQSLAMALEEGLAAAPGPEPDLAVMMPAPGLGSEAAPEKAAEAPGRRSAPAEPAAPHIRVRADLLNRLVNHAGEVSIYRSRLAQQANLQGYRLGELGQTVERLREQLRQLEIETEAQILYRYERDTDTDSPDRAEFDPLELDRFSTLQQLSRSLAETVNDLVSLRGLLSDLQSETESLLLQQARVSDDLQDGLLRTRMVPFAQVVPRLHRLVRQTAQQLGKKAQLQVFGPEVELDRGIQERIVAPLEHLLRNAVAHGIESPERRTAAGKPAAGALSLKLSREGNDVVIAIADDGAGLNLEAIRRRAVQRGLLSAVAEPGEEELAQLILESGFSTADEITQIAGRGVGLDVVNAEIKQLSGSFNLESRPGQGTSFTIRLPLTLAIIEALLVEVAGEVIAIPHATVEAVARISREDLEACHRGEDRTFSYAGNDYRVIYLGGLLRLPGTPELGERRWLPVLLARSGDQRIALHVDLLHGSQRIVVKPLGLQLGSVRWLSGGTILPDGRVALILDLLALIRSGAVHDYVPPMRKSKDAIERHVCIMVVDDSLTVRRVTSRMLRRQDMEVITAQDGIEALTLLEERIPDLILLDIEMPRMDGYELTRHIRRSPRLKDIPLIMITSRTGEKHRRHAMELGVDRYLGKPYQEAELLDEISSVLVETSL